MTIYVTPLEYQWDGKKYLLPKECYMVSETLEELGIFADRYGIPKILSRYRFGCASYTISNVHRSLAVEKGVKEITFGELVTISDTCKKNNKRGKKKREEKTMEPISNTALPVKAFDTETELISYTNPIPDLICMTTAIAGDIKGNIKTPWEHDILIELREGFNNKQHHVGHNVSFDLSILGFKYPELLPDIFNALDNSIIHDTLLREKLLNLTLHGSLDFIEINGCNMRLKYSLADLENKYLNIDRSGLKNDADAPRMNYAMYKNVPLAKWDESFVSYAVDDAINTGLIYSAQELERARCIEITGYDPFVVEAFRVKVSFALRLLECVGSRMDPEMVIEVTERFRTEYAQPRLRMPLLASGLLLEAIPEQPYANGALNHTEACNALADNPDSAKAHKKLRKNKACGCPSKMKAGVGEKNPQRPLFQHIWNLAANNPLIQAWPSDACASDLYKSDIHKDVIEDRAFKKEVIIATGIDTVIKDLEDKIEKAVTACAKKEVKELRVEYDIVTNFKNAGHTVLLPDDIKLKTDEEWASSFAAHEPILDIWAERKALRKIITDYLPKMYYTDEDGVVEPVTRIRGSFYPLCLTGRSSSSASKLYPSRNEQNVDPRVRPCTIADEGMIMISTDYSGMELGTLAQKCINLFGYSVMADNINKGVDNHAYLAAQIAEALDTYFAHAIQAAGIANDRDAIYDIFSDLKTAKTECESSIFCDNFKAKYKAEESKELDRPVLWSDFFGYYRLLAKPTGLGFPGGLGAATMVTFAKGTYKVNLSLELAKKLREVWLETYPEMVEYLKWIKTSCKDPNHSPIEVDDDKGGTKIQTFYCYDTPRGMHRARCGFCETANGTGLQAFSAEGALEALYRVQKAMWLNDYDGTLNDIVLFLDTVDADRILGGSYPNNFLHDEIIWQSPDDAKAGMRVKIVEAIMVNAMEEITPDVKAGAESAAMRRWYKKAEPIWDDNGNIIPWEPEIKKG